MKRICPTCGKIVDEHHDCPARRERINSYKYHTTSKRVHNSARWRALRADIRRRDMGLDQAALHGLDPDYPSPYITQGTEVHHITKIEDDPGKAYDPDNLITLSHDTHIKAEEGRIKASALRKIARKNSKRR